AVGRRKPAAVFSPRPVHDHETRGSGSRGRSARATEGVRAPWHMGTERAHRVPEIPPGAAALQQGADRRRERSAKSVAAPPGLLTIPRTAMAVSATSSEDN